jgi:carnitine 3-dehydrogenase
MNEPVGIVGFGTIGQRWAVAFAHAGLQVRCYDPEPAQWSAFAALRAGLEADLVGLKGPARPGGSITFDTNLEAVLQGVRFVQENGPERLELKQALLRTIEAAVDDQVIIASSSSALLVSDLRAACRLPERIVLGHPFNPAHLMPLVEIVGGSPDVRRRARGFYEAVGKKPVVLEREVPGHLALRLMGAMWREAIALVRDGVASAEDVDRAFCYGPGPKWTLQGSFISNHLNAEGIEAFFEKYGPTYQAIWDDLRAATLDAETKAVIASAVRHDIGDRSDDSLRDQRDRGLVEVLRALDRHGAL